MREQIVERFGLEGEDNDGIAAMLSQQDSDTLQNLVEEFAEDDINIDLEGDESLQCMVMSFALATALEEGRENITAEDIENAQLEFSSDLNQDEEPDEAEDAEEPEADTEHDEQPDEEEDESESASSLRKTVYALVEDNPDAQKSEVVEQVKAMPEFSDRKEGTIAVHYYNYRKEHGLPTIGQRGRPAGRGKLPEIVKKIACNPEMSRAEIIDWSMKELDLAESTAINYYSMAAKQVNGE